MAELSSPIREGFLCPMCHQDLLTSNALISHFQNEHSEEKDILKSVKDLYGKAKKKILKIDDNDLATYRNNVTLREEYQPWSNSVNEQVLGPTRSHLDDFKGIRREKLDHRTTEVNKLIIRLERLMQRSVADRKVSEKDLVSWLDGTTVTRCPSCTLPFNLTRRQHHCRLCGSIMCSSCSYFLPYETALQIIEPVRSVNGNDEASRQFKASDNVRICHHCFNMLEVRRKLHLRQIMQPILCQLYSHLQKLKAQVQVSSDLYNKMYTSLINGDSAFHLQDAESLRSTIAKQAETIDTLSKKIYQLPSDSCAEGNTSTLQASIRRATTFYIKNCLATLPDLPTAEELQTIQERNYISTASEINSNRNNSSEKTIRRITVATGWSPETVVPTKTANNNTATSSSTDSNDNNRGAAVSNDDPLLEQISIVQNYLRQARQAQRHDEIVSLEQNLKMLKRMHSQKINKF